MTADSKGSKIHSGAPKKCNKCDCFLVPDPADPSSVKCLTPKSYKEKCVHHSIPENAATGGSIQSNYVNTAFEEHTFSEKSETDSSSEAEMTMKNICFGFCRSRKDGKVTEIFERAKEKVRQRSQERAIKEKERQKSQERVLKDKERRKLQEPVTPKRKSKADIANQTSARSVSGTKEAKSQDSVEHLAKEYSTTDKKGSGGCNTNTIIFPRDKIGSEGIEKLKTFLHSESHATFKSLEDIRAELSRQTRDIHLVRDTLDSMMRALREQWLLAPLQNGYRDLLDDLYKKHHLERKKSSVSIVDSHEKKTILKDEKSKIRFDKTEEPPPTDDPEMKKKKRSIFAWCH